MKTYGIYILKKLSLVLMIVPMLTSCSKHLSREDAKNQIIQKFNLPHSEFSAFNFREIKSEIDYLEWTLKDNNYGKKDYIKDKSYPKSTIFTNLENDGYITLRTHKIQIDPHSSWMYRKEYMFQVYYIASFTDKATPYINGGSVRIATIKFSEITGIIERKEFKTAEVKYTTKRASITPFGKVYNVNETIFNNSATFTKFDDGWRINN